MDRDINKLMAEAGERWDSLTIANNFVFGKVMLDEGICREVLEAILGVSIERIQYVGREETVDVSPEAKGVRLDAYVRDGRGSVYDIEMQAANTHELPQRSRYYQAMLAFAQLAKGAKYRSLRDSYVIFVCDFDLFEQGRRVYSFTNRDGNNPSLQLNDGAHTIFLAATSPAEPDKGPRVNELLDYVSRGEVSGTLSSRLRDAVGRVLDNQDWRLEYMLQEVRDQLNVDKGHEIGFKEGLAEGHEKGLAEGEEKGLKKGHEQGLAEGREQGFSEGHEKGRTEGYEEGAREAESRFAMLASRLVDEGRAEVVAQAATDTSLRDKLYRQYGIAH